MYNNNNNNKSLYRAYTNCPKRLTIHKFDNFGISLSGLNLNKETLDLDGV